MAEGDLLLLTESRIRLPDWTHRGDKGEKPRLDKKMCALLPGLSKNDREVCLQQHVKSGGCCFAALYTLCVQICPTTTTYLSPEP